MVNFQQYVFAILSTYLPIQSFNSAPASSSTPAATAQPKSIAIIGAGSAGLAMLKTLVELPREVRESLNFALYEEREDLGGVWLPELTTVLPPEIPETPLYPRLRTNTPVPTMTYPGFPFRKGTHLYPSHHFVEAYLQQYASHYNLTPHIRFRSKVLSASWTGTPEDGSWNVTVRDDEHRTLQYLSYNHLVVATGNNHIPNIPSWDGQQEWLGNDVRREILHSVYYRNPERYSNKSVLIIGAGASGRDAALQISPLARKTYISARSAHEDFEGVENKVQVSHFTKDSVVFADGTSLIDVDAIILATGYEMQKPFLEDGKTLIVDPAARSTNGSLVTNLRYLFPLYRHILSLCSSYPPNALSFIGLPSSIANCPSDYAQSLFATHAILDPSILPSREELLAELTAAENEIRRKGLDPYFVGHRLLNGTSSDYQDELVEFLEKKNAIPDDGQKYVEKWRRDVFTYGYIKRGWQRIEKLGVSEDWLRGVETEAQWADLMERVNAWQKKWEEDNKIPYVRDFDLAG